MYWWKGCCLQRPEGVDISPRMSKYFIKQSPTGAGTISGCFRMGRKRKKVDVVCILWRVYGIHRGGRGMIYNLIILICFIFMSVLLCIAGYLYGHMNGFIDGVRYQEAYDRRKI